MITERHFSRLESSTGDDSSAAGRRDINSVKVEDYLITHYQELMSAEGAKERVTLVPSKSKLPTYFRFGEALAASCGLSPT